MIQQHTFLGKSPAVLSMLFEILHAQGHESAQAIIVPNIDTTSAEESGFAVDLSANSGGCASYVVTLRR